MFNPWFLDSADIFAVGATLFQLLTDRLLLGNRIYLQPQDFETKYSHYKHKLLMNSLSEDARDIIWRMTMKDRYERISILNIKNHPFFKNVDWLMLSTRAVQEAYKEYCYNLENVPRINRKKNNFDDVDTDSAHQGSKRLKLSKDFSQYKMSHSADEVDTLIEEYLIGNF